jgi:hypothetical protein
LIGGGTAAGIGNDLRLAGHLSRTSCRALKVLPKCEP